MKKEMSQKAFEELLFMKVLFMKEWNWIIVDFYVKKFGCFFEELHQVITNVFIKKDLRGMRMIYKDNNDMARDLSLDNFNELNQILKEKFGFDLTKVNDKNLAKIKRLVLRGHLKTDAEFRLLLNRVEEIYADDNMKDEVEVLNKLMRDYENYKANKVSQKRTQNCDD